MKKKKKNNQLILQSQAKAAIMAINKKLQGEESLQLGPLTRAVPTEGLLTPLEMGNFPGKTVRTARSMVAHSNAIASAMVR